jgi:hypothetical protein
MDQRYLIAATRPDLLRRYPHGVLLPLLGGASSILLRVSDPRKSVSDPRKKWLYSNWESSSWITLDVERHSAEDGYTYWREYRFRTEQELLMFNLRWKDNEHA